LASGAQRTASENGRADAMSETSTIIPVLVYADIEAGHDYLVKVFGFTPEGVNRDDEGTPVHGEVSLGGQVIWMHRVTAEHEMGSPKDAPFSHSGLSVRVEDVDAHFERAKAAGAQIDAEPTDMPYGLREYGARDNEGHRFWFASPIG
jgi:MerR family transcriptional regulator, thiopeptide resistance regulator